MDTALDMPRAVYANAGFRFRRGEPLPFGATVLQEGVNFAVQSHWATHCMLVLIDRQDTNAIIEIPVPDEYRVGSVFAIMVLDLDPDRYAYGYRMDGPQDAQRRFNPETILLDPYARAITGRETWAEPSGFERPKPYFGLVVCDDTFDWEGDRPLMRPSEDTVIYEMHVRGFTQDASSGVQNRGTYSGLIEKIPYLKELGVNCVELMPVFEFNEFENWRENPETHERVLKYWGYSTVGFFAPKAGYAASGAADTARDEFKTLVKRLHQNDIEVILDVVFNHTAEGNENGPIFSFKGIDNPTYYLLTPEGFYYNFSGTGNTFNCNHPTVTEFIIDCLRYWVTEYHIDGFRFDLASILTRDMDGSPMADPPLVRMMAYDPILSHTKLIAEPWDAGGLYHVGSFPPYGRWSEWNGRYRDTVRKFLKGDAGQVGDLAQAIQGWPLMYESRGPIASINFITAHDGFTLIDLVSYNEKHNEANLEGENGANDNCCWNHGAEGQTDDPQINAFRKRQMKNAIAVLLVSQGVPMLQMGDEVGRTSLGNNNTYCQDNALSWLDWNLKEQNGDLFRFFRLCIAFRMAHAALRNGYFLRHQDYIGSGCPDISLHGTKLNKPDYSEKGRAFAFMLCGQHAKGGLMPDDDIYVAMNMDVKDLTFDLPQYKDGKCWYVFANTGDEAAEIHELGQEVLLENQKRLPVKAHSVVILVGR
jgi:isoamylase